MDVVQAMKDYLSKMLSDIQGMKVLMMDVETTGMISVVESQTGILSQEVFLTERLDNDRGSERMLYLKAVVFVRPTAQNISAWRSRRARAARGAARARRAATRRRC